MLDPSVKVCDQLMMTGETGRVRAELDQGQVDLEPGEEFADPDHGHGMGVRWES